MIRKILIKIFPKLGLQLIYHKSYGKFANVKNPQDLYEKLIWLNFNNPDKRRTLLADKVLVREHLEKQGYGKYLNKVYGIYNTPDEIKFDELPDEYMLKCNHGANYNIYCCNPDEQMRKNIKSQLQKWLREDYSLRYAELHYRKIERKIICEEYIGSGIKDYKVYCFNGTPKYIMVCTNRGNGNPDYHFYTFDWEYKDLLYYHYPDPGIARPERLEELYDFCSSLSADWPFVRIDTYIHDDKIIFSEMTFTPSGFIDKEILPEAKLAMGSMLHLPEEKHTVPEETKQ